MREGQAGPRNHQWKGGRVVASNGYVLVRVGRDHPLSDVRGYAYEHRIVAAQKLGRWPHPWEIVHHVDGDKTNNVPDNIVIEPSIAHHLRHHRRPEGPRLRDPDEINIVVSCACGCGARFRRFDRAGRARRFISGHNLQPPSKEAP